MEGNISAQSTTRSPKKLDEQSFEASSPEMRRGDGTLSVI